VGGARGTEHQGITRRTLLAAGAGFAVSSRLAFAASTPVIRSLDFSGLADAEHWPDGWACAGVANLRVVKGLGLLEAGTDVFPSDPRPVAFAVDARFRDGSVRAVVSAPGSQAGVVVRRTAPRDYYAAIYDLDSQVLSIVRRTDLVLVTLAELPGAAGNGDLTLELAASGASPTKLTATLTDAGGVPLHLTAQDSHPALQAAGDAGVLSQARTIFPSGAPSAYPALGNFHLLPYGVQEGEAVLATPEGHEIIDEITRESTVAFRSIAITSADAPAKTPASVVAATTGLPLLAGGRLHVASDLPADVTLEVADTPGFEHPRQVAAGKTGAYEGYAAKVRELVVGRRAYWRATLRRAGTTTVGPVRSFPVLPGPGDPRNVRLAIAACGAQFGPLFDDLAGEDPDVFVWQGDLNYPDTVGPLAQSLTGYAGIWRDFLANPALLPVLERSAFVAMRDDHDYAAQDSNSITIPHFPWGVAPWDALMNPDIGCRFSAGLADVWVLDERRFKTDPNIPDKVPSHTLLGDRQREWLLAGLRSSRAPFKIICSPCTVFMRANRRDGNWSDGYEAERDAVLKVIDEEVSGRTIFVTGDTHLTGVYEKGNHFEARPCPVGIPPPNDITLTDPQAAKTLAKKDGVVYANDRCHYAMVEIHGEGDTATLKLSLRRDDGATPYTKTFTQAIPPARLGLRVGRRHGRRVPVSVSLDRPGYVQVNARIGTRLVDRVVDFTHAGTRRLTLRLGARPSRFVLKARYRSPTGKRTLRRLRRRL
jgi:hypothetical protein